MSGSFATQSAHLTVLATEMYDIINEQRGFDEAKCNANLRRLPELPYENDA